MPREEMTEYSSEKIALVTGGANGIGRAIAFAMAQAGFRVVVFDRELALPSENARAMVGDVSREGDVISLFESIQKAEGRLDIAVNCAGIQLIKPLLETSADDLNRVLGVNVRGTFLVGREAARMMLARKSGRIINIASELAYLGRADYSAYCASKGAIISLTRAMARELAPHILVNTVAPGPTDTAMVSLDCMTDQQMREELAAVPLGRIARPEEIAASVLFLAGDGGNFFTGQCISPNGGAVMF